MRAWALGFLIGCTHTEAIIGKDDGTEIVPLFGGQAPITPTSEVERSLEVCKTPPPGPPGALTELDGVWVHCRSHEVWGFTQANRFLGRLPVVQGRVTQREVAEGVWTLRSDAEGTYLQTTLAGAPLVEGAVRATATRVLDPEGTVLVRVQTSIR